MPYYAAAYVTRGAREYVTIARPRVAVFTTPRAMPLYAQRASAITSFHAFFLRFMIFATPSFTRYCCCQHALLMPPLRRY